MGEPRRCFFLPADDSEYLDNAFPLWEAIDGNWVLLPEFGICPGYTVNCATVAIKIPISYPATQLDMAYFFPPVIRVDGRQVLKRIVAFLERRLVFLYVPGRGERLVLRIERIV